MAEQNIPDRTNAGTISAWVGIATSVVTVALTFWNVHTKDRIDAAEERLKAREADLHDRAQRVEENKEEVARYQFVASLIPKLTEKAQVRTMNVALIRLALSPDKANTLFGGLAQSNDKSLQEAGQTGLANLESEASSNDLIFRINGAQPEDRKAALSILTQRYKGSPATISAVLRLFDDPGFSQLSTPGVINALHFLANTNPSAWSLEQLDHARDVIDKVQKKSPGPQTQTEIKALQPFLQRVTPTPNH